ncbi:glycosyltransferase family 4 protein [Pseudogracilibacillus auburnensis]|uniref:UDP-GlcNAc:undecaprenyl-phosphate GlcNAc-1-phosphate transferase n=1 Tax=Pseudogracilibacillus auburnensis TaxID=1494959 RepID=A0A2V3VY49_9BACI|nr:MraY family glycosyltransferase [Pseudogracilibacillus auburnensis]PXW85854.1 UDP-GlcNAc:undecaprenyl-phosphate GlcNAc-1-phosphate transferase [Pseudogracilibacillus auburnensis]
MLNYVDLMIASFIALISTFFLTFLVKKLAFKFNIVDFPNQRKIHKKATPRIGGLAIFIGAALGLLYLQPEHVHLLEISLGALVIVITGILDDKFDIRPIIKLSGQLIAASFLISSGLIIERVTLPFIGMIDLGVFSVLITVLWVVGITNAINLIDGLDGLATGVSTFALLSMFVMALVDLQIFAAYLSIVLIGANLGFLYHNFYPAKIYMGDTGSNFLGYMIAVISMLGLFKNIALFSFIIPVIVLAVPIFDTLFAIVRRITNKQQIMKPDNKHIHYQLLRVGFTHRQSVLIMYAFSLIFGILAILFAKASLFISLLVTCIVLVLIHILAEIAGLVMGGKRPVVDIILKMFGIRQRIISPNDHKD